MWVVRALAISLTIHIIIFSFPALVSSPDPACGGVTLKIKQEIGNEKWEMGKWGNGTTMPGILTQIKEDSGVYILCKVYSSSIT